MNERHSTPRFGVPLKLISRIASTPSECDRHAALADRRSRALVEEHASGCKVRSMLTERFARLAALRGDVVNGIPTTAWASNLDDVERDQLLRAVIEAIRALVLPEWESKRPEDRRPQVALEATEAWLAAKTEENVASVKAAAKDCTA